MAVEDAREISIHFGFPISHPNPIQNEMERQKTNYLCGKMLDVQCDVGCQRSWKLDVQKKAKTQKTCHFELQLQLRSNLKL